MRLKYPQPVGKPILLVTVAVLALPTAAAATPWRDEPAVTALFRNAAVNSTFVLLDERCGELRGHNRERAEQGFSPASTSRSPTPWSVSIWAPRRAWMM